MNSSRKNKSPNTKEIERVTNCLIPLVDPTADQRESLTLEFSQIIEKLNYSEIIDPSDRSRKNLIGWLTDYLFARNNKR